MLNTCLYVALLQREALVKPILPTYPPAVRAASADIYQESFSWVLQLHREIQSRGPAGLQTWKIIERCVEQKSMCVAKLEIDWLTRLIYVARMWETIIGNFWGEHLQTISLFWQKRYCGLLSLAKKLNDAFSYLSKASNILVVNFLWLLACIGLNS